MSLGDEPWAEIEVKRLGMKSFCVSTSNPRPVGGSEHEDDEEPDPDDVEADLEAILRDRISASDDDEEDEDEGPATDPGGTDQPSARQETELVCPHCFLLVQAETIAETGECGHCGGPIS